MKSNELKIGNFVSVKENELKPFLDDYGLNGYIENSFEVVSIDNVHLNIFIDGLECEYYLSDCEPIPLTEEWLVKFGFEGIDYTCPENGFITKNESFELEIDTYSRIIIESDFSFGIESLDKKSDVIFKNDILDSVHRLQNLYFALTGKELEIL